MCWKYSHANYIKTNIKKKKKKMGLTPCKAEQPLQGMELKEKDAQNDSTW